MTIEEEKAIRNSLLCSECNSDLADVVARRNWMLQDNPGLPLEPVSDVISRYRTDRDDDIFEDETRYFCLNCIESFSREHVELDDKHRQFWHFYYLDDYSPDELQELNQRRDRGDRVIFIPQRLRGGEPMRFGRWGEEEAEEMDN
jgi:hypothetical protein